MQIIGCFRYELPPKDWFRIDVIVFEKRFVTLARHNRLLRGYFYESNVF